jgi:hypothetical protein
LDNLSSTIRKNRTRFSRCVELVSIATLNGQRHQTVLPGYVSATLSRDLAGSDFDDSTFLSRSRQFSPGDLAQSAGQS